MSREIVKNLKGGHGGKDAVDGNIALARDAVPTRPWANWDGGIVLAAVTAVIRIPVLNTKDFHVNRIDPLDSEFEAHPG
jgi:hypothetical protein